MPSSKSHFQYRTIIATVLFIAWCAMAIYGALHHEIWRDEMRALSIAIEAPHYSELPSYLKNEGHPILWYLVLKLSFDIFGNTSVLPVLSLLFAAGISFLLLFRSSLPLLLSASVIFGALCLYDYGINCRNYGIAGFLILLFAESYRKNPGNYLLNAFILALAAQANIYASVLCTLAAAWMYAEVPKTSRYAASTVCAALLSLASFAFVLYVTLPDKNSLVMDRRIFPLENPEEIWDIGFGFDKLLLTWFPYKHGFVTIILLLSLMVFISKPRTMLFLYLGAAFMTFFHLYIRYNFMQHQGMWIYLYLAFLYIHYDEIRGGLLSFRHLQTWLIRIGASAFMWIIASHSIRGMESYFADIQSPKSDSPFMGDWSRQHIKAGDVIIAEPDYIMEPVMYYHYRQFYLPREGRFNSFVHFTMANDSSMSLSRMLDIADSFSKSGKTPYIVLEKKPPGRDTVFTYTFGKRFLIDSASDERLKRQYTLKDSFWHNYYTDEHYFIYTKKAE